MHIRVFLTFSVPLLVMAAGPCARETSGISESEIKAIEGTVARHAPQILKREDWQAKPALPGMKEQKRLSIIVHHTGVAQNPKVDFTSKMRNLQSFSQKPAQLSPTRTREAWPDLPYHFYIDFSGHIAEGRDARYAGDTNTNYDTLNHIQVAVEGNFETETPAPEQLAALEQLLAWLMLSSNLAPGKISVHKDHAPTDCPGRNLIARLPDVLAGAAARRDKLVTEICSENPDQEFTKLYCRRK